MIDMRQSQIQADEEKGRARQRPQKRFDASNASQAIGELVYAHGEQKTGEHDGQARAESEEEGKEVKGVVSVLDRKSVV